MAAVPAAVWLARLRTLLAVLWLGLVASLGGLVTPTAFALLARSDAGRVAGALFAREAQLSLLLAMVLFLIERHLAAQRAERGLGSRVSANVLLVLGVLFCTVLGYFAPQPMMEAARAGQGRIGFGLLHGISTSFFVLKGLLLLALAWRVTAAPA